MNARKISKLFSVQLCLAAVLAAGLGAAEHGYYGPYSTNPPETAQERANLLAAMQKLDESSLEASSGQADPYQALQNPYVFRDPQSALELANAYKAIQKLNSLGFGPHSGDSWHYWASMWLQGPKKGSAEETANAYGAMENPYAYKDPQSALELANAYKAIQKLNSLGFGPHSGDSWHYWASMWLQGPQNS